MPNLIESQSTKPLTTWNYGSQKCPAHIVTNRLKLLTAGHRRGEAEDPDGYVLILAAILSRYPESVVYAVTDPVDGLPSQLDWLPKPAELKRACEAEAAKQFAAEAKRSAPRLQAPEKPASAEQRERAVAEWERIKREIFARNLVGTAEVGQ